MTRIRWIGNSRVGAGGDPADGSDGVADCVFRSKQRPANRWSFGRVPLASRVGDAATGLVIVNRQNTTHFKCKFRSHRGGISRFSPRSGLEAPARSRALAKAFQLATRIPITAVT